MPADKFDILAAALRTEFVNGFVGVVDPAPIEGALERLPSKARIEHYPWLSPIGAFTEWDGFRRFSKVFNTTYRLQNKSFQNGFEVLDEDLDDFQVAGYEKKAGELGKKGKIFPIREVQRLLGVAAVNAQTVINNGSPTQDTLCWDGSQVFAPAAIATATPTATQHIYGNSSNGLGNVLQFQAASGTGSYKIVALMKNAGYGIKPLIWQDRQPPELQTDAGTPEARKKKLSQWWADLRGNVGFAYWWDALAVLCTNLPTVQEFQTIIGSIQAQFRTFGLPLTMPTDTVERVHEQTQFNEKNMMFVVSTGLEHIARQALTLSLIANTENIFKGAAELVASGFLD